MAKKRSPTHSTAEPPRIDDLKLINGVGPGVEKRLNGVGIFTYAQLAALSPADIAAAVTDLTGLSAERIIKQDWIGQAHMLAEEVMLTETQEDIGMPADSEQTAVFTTPGEEPLNGDASSKERFRTATFSVEFLIDENNNVLRMDVVHVESGRAHTWSGWQHARLVDFLSQSAGLNVSSIEPSPPIAEELEYASVRVEESEPLSPVTARLLLAGKLYLRDMETIGAESEGPRRILYHEQPFDVRLTLDLTELIVPENTPLKYRASIFGKNRSSRSGQFLREAEGTLIPANTVTIDLPDNTLPQGTYQLAATVILALPTMKLIPKLGSMAIIDGGLVQVY